MSRPTLSACLIVRDEERMLPGALASVAFCDEVVVVDSGSQDRTRQIARDAGAVLVERDWPGFAVQRNTAIDHATGDWILEVDADERISPALATEIRAFLDDPQLAGAHDIVALPMRHEFLGGWLESAVKYPCYRYRLFRRGSHRHDERRTVHEGLWASSPAWAMRHDMEHELAPTMRAALADLRAYTLLEAAQFSPPRSPRAVVVGVAVRPVAKTLYRLLVDRAWRDGWRGILKVVLDAAGDAGVWLLALRRPADAAGADEATRSSHFSGEPPPGGAVRLVGVATDEQGTREVEGWLREAAGHGADVALLTPVTEAVGGDRAPGDGPERTPAGMRLRRLESGTALAVVRGLDAERQVRQIEALVLPSGGLPPLARRAAARIGHRAPVHVPAPVAATLDGLVATRPGGTG